MITKPDRRFIDHWLEQKSGPKWKYYFQFIVAWTIVSFLVIFFLTKFFTSAWETGGRYMIISFAALSVLAGFLATHLTYTLSEKRYQKILQKEKESSKE
ncbi:MAG: hypothetical protein M3R50_09940 [Bacteroidota bacterium]|nr:hypothetical protein [Bacteroidota bacterium]